MSFGSMSFASTRFGSTRFAVRAAALFAAAACAGSAAAEGTRSADAHEHGVSVLQIAIEGEEVAMRLASPGADIVGFERDPATAEEEAAIEAAEDVLLDPLALFVASGDCALESAKVAYGDEELHGAGEHDHDHDHGHADHDDHDQAHDDHGHDDHAHDDHAHDDHAHDDHAHGEEEHAEFTAVYALHCETAPVFSAAAFFDAFPNAEEVEAVVLSDEGQAVIEATRDAPVIDASSI